MILPTKHISVGRSLIGTSALVLEHSRGLETVSELWYRLQTIDITFDEFISALDLLYMMGAVEFENGLLKRIHNDT